MGICALKSKPAAPSGSTQRIDLIEREPAGNDRDRNAQPRRGLAGEVGDQRPWPGLARAGSEHQDRDARLLVDQGDEFVLWAAFPDIDDRHRAGDRQHIVAELLHQLLGGLAALLARELLNRDPVLDLDRLYDG